MAAIYGNLVNIVEGGLTDTTGYSALISQEAIEYIADYADGLGPWKNNFLLREGLSEAVDGNCDGVAQIGSRLTGAVHPFLYYALAAGLEVHPYTLRAEEGFLTMHNSNHAQTVRGEVLQLLSLGITGFFIDQPDQGVIARDLFMRVNSGLSIDGLFQKEEQYEDTTY